MYIYKYMYIYIYILKKNVHENIFKPKMQVLSRSSITVACFTFSVGGIATCFQVWGLEYIYIYICMNIYTYTERVATHDAAACPAVPWPAMGPCAAHPIYIFIYVYIYIYIYACIYIYIYISIYMYIHRYIHTPSGSVQGVASVARLSRAARVSGFGLSLHRL